jgi:hypothetical protein
MNDIVALKDYLIADEIRRIESLTREQLVRELIEVKSVQIELLTDLESIRKYGRDQKQN